MADRSILFDKPLPEVMVRAPYKAYTNKVMGTILVTAGFMEPTGHGYKSTSRRAIFKDGTIKTISPGNYNIGFDYTKGFGSNVICMYSGVVTKAGREGGYGHRIHVKIDTPFIWQGKNYICYQAYAHNSKILKRVGDRVSQGEAIAIEAGHGSNSPTDYGSHVDLDTYFYLKGEKIHLNFELLAGSVDEDDYIEPFEVMNLGSKGLDVELLQQMLKIPITGDYDKATKSTVEANQLILGLDVDGIAGEETCLSLNLTGYFLKIRQDTKLKAQPVQSSALAEKGIIEVFKDDLFMLNWVEDVGDHWKFELRSPLNQRYNWYAFKSHVSLAKGYDEEDKVDELGDVDLSTPGIISNTGNNRWYTALQDCATNGCSNATAKANGVEQGVVGSKEIMHSDYIKITETKAKIFIAIANKHQVPAELIIALASRESHLGTVLGAPSGSNPGWGDHNTAFGILQIDRRYHTIKGKPDPFSEAHIDQAISIFASYRDQLIINQPDWDDSNILKGACVAYNSGVSNVRTIAGMNDGTTGNDYGDDVIARAQYLLDI